MDGDLLTEMAPRRTRVGLRRIDAAYDALAPMGFPKDVVRRTIRNLLKAYGGDEGWRFIEDCSYQLVIDTILEEQANTTEQENLEANCPEEVMSAEQENLEVNGPEEDDNVEDEPESQPCPPPAHSPEIHSAPVHSPLVASPSPGMHSISGFSNGETSQDRGGRQVPSPQSSSPVPLRVQLQSPVNSLPIRRRKPCYGWLSSDDEEQELCYLAPSNHRHR